MILDLFAGPGGWDTGLALYLGIVDVVGLEWDPAACATRDAAGHRTIQVDVAAFDPADADGTVGLIASPPCQMFSAAGSKAGRGAIDLLAAATRAIVAGDPDPRPGAREEAAAVIRSAMDPETPGDLDALAARQAYNACLVLEPVRFAVALRPEWIALEQVPSVLPLWEEFARGLRSLGYRTWTGILNAADYGVPQTRRRAVLMAHRDRPVAPPHPTHAESPEPSLFGPELLPWVTMADALGWSGRVGFPRLDDRGDSEDGYRARDWTSTDEPAPTLTEKARSWVLQPGSWADGRGGNRRLYSLDEPAPTLHFGNDAAGWEWIEAVHVNTGRDWKKGGSRADAQVIDALVEPAPTIDGKGRWRVDVTARRNDQSGAGEVDPDWPLDRPATTLATRDLVPDPGANANRFNGAGKSRNDGYRVDPPEASVLQSFPANYPWQGTRSKIYEQIGNAVPCRLAAHIVRALIPERTEP